ncbi:putative membrane protein [Lasiodiplodia hormozganensis]|uniref:Membrane protein n=1 Tax=Lasiodiplodia hormozganensis TaxID=869390 RepID=A0AA39YCM0_9PEZI|nr:putative membrane protein [Lasiodiplodia hormozganensis]
MEPRSPWLALLAFLSLLQVALSQTVLDGVTYVDATVDGEIVLVRDNRQPSLYTSDFGDCMGDSSINVTRFDAAFYKDNMTVLFHLAGDTNIESEGLMMYIAVYAYGESQFELIFNPCNANIDSLCPVRNNVSIEASGIIPVAQSDVQNIPSIAYTIPDFEGQAILRIFANSTQQLIGCYSAVITNGATFSHPYAVGSILGIFAFIALVASFATAIYGSDVPAMRKHYAHSMSIFVVFAVLQHIFFTGALSMNWPSVLVAFWSNYAWSAGMIYTESMQNSINNFIGSNMGNTSAVGAASPDSDNSNIGGGYDISLIYRRAIKKTVKKAAMHLWRKDIFDHHSPRLERALSKRALAGSGDGYDWYGNPVKPGLPLPGNYSGFAGTLAQEDIPASNAFMTGFLWFLILLVIIAASVVAFKWLVEGLICIKALRRDRLTYFRSHWLGYTVLATLRTLFIGFFAMIFLTLFQFTYEGAPGVLAVAAIVFAIFLCGMFGVAGYACYYRVRVGNYVSEPDRLNLERRRVLGCIPWFRFSRASSLQDDEEKVYAGSLPFWRISHNSPETQKSVHEDEEYTKKFGWLASRFRRTRWWFFTCWLFYEFVRACFLAGASGHPLVQVFGLLVVEFLAFVAIIIMRPFESQRLNAMMIYLLGFSKVATVALSAAFDIRFNIARITTTVIGIVIIVIQGVLTIFLMISIIVGACSTWMSVKRHREKDEFRPRNWRNLRDKYFAHMDKAMKDLPPEPPAPVIPPPTPEEPKVGFNVSSVRRVAKIEDEDPDFLADIGNDPRGSEMTLQGLANARTSEDGTPTPAGRRRPASIMSQMSYTSLPRTARVHRASWSSRDFLDMDLDQEPMPGGHSRTNSLGHSRSTSHGHPRTRASSSGRQRATSLGTARSSDRISRMGTPTGIPELSQLNRQITEHREEGDYQESPDAISPVEPHQYPAGRKSTS